MVIYSHSMESIICGVMWFCKHCDHLLLLCVVIIIIYGWIRHSMPFKFHLYENFKIYEGDERKIKIAFIENLNTSLKTA